jgi:hypothetical protein
MAPEQRGRDLLLGTKARPRFERLDRRLNHKSRRDERGSQAERLADAVATIKRRFGPDAIALAADLIAEGRR